MFCHEIIEVLLCTLATGTQVETKHCKIVGHVFELG